ncbi:MAG TPA: tetratricopeptide repeat protein [Chloroflexi bacterium]|nr:tetratricopeptide repeat protein [Chloroflexota bacterium]
MITTEREELERAIAVLEAQRIILGDDVVNTMIATAREKLAAIETQQAIEQRKQVTVLFADVSDFTAMAETMDPEEVRDTMNALWKRLDLVITSYEGTIDKHMGDSVMAIFGAPTAREDDPERAVRAALAMQREVKAWVAEMGGMDPQISIRIGIHTGPVLLGAVGTTAEYTAMGDTVNVAKRLQEAAPVGGILVSHDTYRHVRGLFSVWMMDPIVIKGKAEPVPAYVVLRARPRSFRLETRGVEGVDTRMIGREEELAHLQQTLRTVIERQEAQIVTVLGEAGVGKSRLLYEFDNWIAMLLEKFQLFKGRADEKTSNMPYFLFRDLFSFRFEIQDNDPAAMAREKLENGITEFLGVEGVDKTHFIGHLIGFDFSTSPHLRGIIGDARQIHDRAFYYTAQFFTAVARQGPTAVFLEDVHWASEGSLDLIEYLARECRQVPLLIVCLARPTLFERRSSWGERQAAHTRLELGPLSEEHSHQLVAEILRKVDRIPPDLLNLSVSRAEGNPFYIEEFIKVLIEDGVIVTGPERWRVDTVQLTKVRVPPTMVGVLQARLDRLSPLEREILQRAAVVGRTFWEGAVARICESTDEVVDRGEIRAVLQALRDKELIFRRDESAFAGEREYVFKHAILHDVTYESVLKRLRRSYHAQVAPWLFERSGERVGEYAGLIGEHYEQSSDLTQAAGWYGRAGSQARNAYAPEEAIGYYQKALALLQSDDEIDREKENLVHAYAIQQVVLYEGLGEMLLWQARYADAMDAYTAMRLTAARSGDAVAQARAWNGLSRTQDAHGDYAVALESAQRAEEIALGAGGAARMELARALFRKGWGVYRLGDTDAALTLGRHALALSTELGARREIADSLNLLGGVYSMLGNQGGAAIYNARAIALYQELGDQEGIASMLNHQGDQARLRGDYNSAVALYQEALKIAYETGNRNGEMAFLSNLGGARVGQGEYRIAEHDLRRTIRWAEIVGQGGWLSNAYRFLAKACLGQGKVDEALVATRRALTLGKGMGSPTLIGSAWRVLGMVLTLANRSITLDGETYTAPDCFAEAVRIFTTVGAEGERARTLRAWARYELDFGERERGEEIWRQARALFTRLGMKMEVDRMENWSCAYPGEGLAQS